MNNYKALRAFLIRERDLEWECALESRKLGVNGIDGGNVAVGSVEAYNKVLAYMQQLSKSEARES